MSRILCVGDIHGGHLALQQVLERSSFDKEEDTLICLGDVADGWAYVYETVEELLSIKNLIAIRGNHDDWFIHWLKYGSHPASWLQGGKATAESYIRYAQRDIPVYGQQGAWNIPLTYLDIPSTHVDFWYGLHDYYIDDKNNLFVHGGIDRHRTITQQPRSHFWWDRDFFMSAMSYEASRVKDKYPFKIKDNFNEVFIGHTTTESWYYPGTKIPITTPIHAANVWNLDTGAGWSGKLTIMDVNTKDYWQSDTVKSLYPNETGRG
jgi:serine/threonine protein phosphatase 1